MEDEKLRELLKQESETMVERCTPYHVGSFVQGFIAGAEPREKQIADLELTNSKLKEQLSLRYNLEDKIALLEQQIEKMKCCGNCDHYRWSNGEDWCNDHYGQPMYDEECKGKWKLRR